MAVPEPMLEPVAEPVPEPGAEQELEPDAISMSSFLTLQARL